MVRPTGDRPLVRGTQDYGTREVAFVNTSTCAIVVQSLSNVRRFRGPHAADPLSSGMHLLLQPLDEPACKSVEQAGDGGVPTVLPALPGGSKINYLPA